MVNTLTDEQKCAVDAIIHPDKKFSIVAITGGPGTGKTTILREVVKHFDSNEISYRLTSFTGKAVSRIIEQTQCLRKNASTLHRLIAKGDFNHSYLIIDEASMVSMQLFYTYLQMRHVLQDSEFHMILVGDSDQLPPIGWGSPFQDVLEASIEGKHGLENVPVYRLSKNFRVICSDSETEKEESDDTFSLVNIFQDIKNGIIPIYEDEKMDKITDFYQILELTSHKDILTKIIKDKDIKEPREIGVFSPYNGEVLSLNKVLKGIFNEDCKDVTIFSESDRVLMTKNVYNTDKSTNKNSLRKLLSKEEEEESDLFLMNGDTGTITRVENDDLYIDFDSGFNNVKFLNREISFSERMEQISECTDLKSVDMEEDMPQQNAVPLTSASSLHIGLLKMGYALTIHKSQGSEYEHVVVFLPSLSDKNSFINKNLFYTGLTRAKKSVTIVLKSANIFSSPDDAIQTILNTKSLSRCSNLVDRILLNPTKIS